VFYQTASSAAGQALLLAGGLRPDPVVLIGVHVRAVRMLDLRDNATRLTLGVNGLPELLGAWRGIPNAPTQGLGDAVFNDGHFEGILFPSAQNAGRDAMVLFPARLQSPSQVDFTDVTTNLAARLP
jgi:RES domain-containing protein